MNRSPYFCHCERIPAAQRHKEAYVHEKHPEKVHEGSEAQNPGPRFYPKVGRLRPGDTVESLGQGWEAGVDIPGEVGLKMEVPMLWT